MNALSLRAALFARSFFLQAGFGDERRQGLGFAWAIDPALRAAHAAHPGHLAAARERHLGAFNCQPHAAGLPLGVVAALELKAGAGDAAAAARAAALKPALGAALSGAADGFFWGSLRPLAAALAAAVGIAGVVARTSHSIAAGVALGLLAFNAPALYARWRGLTLGLRDGEGAAVAAAALPVPVWSRRLRLAALGLVVASALAGLRLPFAAPPAWAAAAFAVGAGLSRAAGGALRLVGAAALLAMAASAAGWV